MREQRIDALETDRRSLLILLRNFEAYSDIEFHNSRQDESSMQERYHQMVLFCMQESFQIFQSEYFEPLLELGQLGRTRLERRLQELAGGESCQSLQEVEDDQEKICKIMRLARPLSRSVCQTRILLFFSNSPTSLDAAKLSSIAVKSAARYRQCGELFSLLTKDWKQKVSHHLHSLIVDVTSC